MTDESEVERPAEPAPALPVLHQEEAFVAVSKPSGLLVHRDEHHPDAPAALQLVRDQLQQHLYPFHRLDRATSGILLFGLSRRSAAGLQRCLAAADAHKDYLALLRHPGSGPELEAITGFDEGPVHPDWKHELQKRGIYRKDYSGSTLRDHLGLARPDIGAWKTNLDQ